MNSISSTIYSYITNLQSNNINETQLQSVLTSLHQLFKRDRIYICLYNKLSEESIYITLYNIYMCTNNEDIHGIIHLLLETVLINIVCDKTIYNYIYQQLSYYYFNQRNLNESIVLKNLSYLRMLYKNGASETQTFIVKPHNYFFFPGNNSYLLCNVDKGELPLKEGITIVMWFRMDIVNVNSGDTSFNVVKLVTNDNDKEIVLNINKPNEHIQTEYFTLLCSSDDDELISDELVFYNNTYCLLVCSISVNDMSVYVNKTEHQFKIQSITPNTEVKSLSFFNNSICECSSIIILNTFCTKRQIDMEYLIKEFPYGIKNISNVEKITNKIINNEAIYSLYLPINISSANNSNYITTNNNKTSIIIDNCCSKASPAELIGDAGWHSYNNIVKNIANIGGVEPIVPIIEMIYTSMNNNIIKVSNEMIYEYFDIIYAIINNRKTNVDILEESRFFQVVSLFIEKFPPDVFTLDLMKIFLLIKQSIETYKNKSLYQMFFENILLNEKIYYKFPTEVHAFLWESLSEQLLKFDIETILSLLPISKICLLLKYYDEKRYFEYCCEEHKNAFISGLNTKTMNPNLEKKTETLIHLVQAIMNKVDPGKSKETIILFQILCLDLSPCLTKIIVGIIINLFCHTNLYLKFRNEVIADNTKSSFDDIITCLLMRNLPDVKSHIIYLLTLAKKNKKLDDEYIDELNYHINYNKAFYISNPYIDSEFTESDVAALAKLCAEKVQMKITNDNVEYQSKSEVFLSKDNCCIFNEEYLNKTYLPIYKTLMQLMLNRPHESYKTNDEMVLQETDNIYNEKVVEILINFVLTSKEKELNEKLNKDLNVLFIKNYNNCYNIYSNKILNYWTIHNMYNNFNSNSNSDSTLFKLAKSINENIYINTILQDRKYKKVLQSYPTMTINNVLNWAYRYLNNPNTTQYECVNIHKFILQYLTSYYQLLRTNLNNEKTSEGLVYQNIITLFSIVLDYSTLYKCTFDEITHDNDNEWLQLNNYDINRKTILPHIYIISSTRNDGDTSFEWKEYELLQSIYTCFSGLCSFGNILQFCQGGLVNKNLLERAEIIVKCLLYNKDTKNVFIETMKTLNYVFISELNLKLSKCILIFLSIKIHFLNTTKDKTLLEKWIYDLKNFVIYYIVGACNTYPSSSKNENYYLYQSLMNDSGDIFLYAVCFLYEQYYRFNNSNEFTLLIKESLQEIFSLGMIITEHIKTNIEKSRRFSINIFKGTHRKELAESTLYQILNDAFNVDNSVSIISQLKKEKFENVFEVLTTYNDVKCNLFNNERLQHNLKSFLGIIDYKTKYTRRKDDYIPLNKLNDYIKYNVTKRQSSDNNTSESKIIKIIQKYQINISKYSTGSFVVVKEKRNMYKKMKKKLFLWKGMWSNYDDLYNNKLKLKVLNHYTKYLSRPLLIPILDIDYYIPEFTNFKTEKMFTQVSSNKINLDIDMLLQTKGSSFINDLNTHGYINDSDTNDMNYLNHIDYKTNKKLYKLNLNFTKKIFLQKEEDFMTFFNEVRILSQNETLRKNENYYLCCFVKPSHHIKGVLFVDKDSITFRVFINQIKGNNIVSDEDFDESVTPIKTRKANVYDEGFDFERNTCFGSYFVYHHKDKDAMTFTMPYDQLTFIFRRRYYQRNTAIELFSKKHKSYYFVLKSQNERESAIKDILAHVASETKHIKIDSCKPKDEFANVIGYELGKRTFLEKKKLTHLIKSWQSCQISTFEFIMWINIYGNRSFSDLSQYPVFPWIITNYGDNAVVLPKDMRDFTLPMGMMTLNSAGENRKETYEENFNTIAEEANDPDLPCDMPKQVPFYYGSHYSNPIYVVHYLTRLFPYSHISIELQGDKFDKADRLFLNVGTSFNCSSSSKGDVRELIAEFFYLPEMFNNINHLNLGTTQDETNVDNVVCPNWSGNDPYKFIYNLRKHLESEEVGQKISSWLDLIFGYKQKGKEAVNAKNVYYADSYEINIDKMKSHDEKVVKLKMVEFGVTPKQISTVEFPIRKRDVSNKSLFDSFVLWKCNALNVRNGVWGTNTKYNKLNNLAGFKVVDGTPKLICFYREDDDPKIFKFPSITSSNTVQTTHSTLNTNINAVTTNIQLQATASVDRISKVLSIKSIKEKDDKKYNYLGKVSAYYNIETNIKSPPILYIQHEKNSGMYSIIQGGYYNMKLLLTNVDTSYIDSSSSNQLTHGKLPSMDVMSSSTLTLPDQIKSNHIKLVKVFYIEKEPFPITSLCLLNSPEPKKEVLIILGNSIGNTFVLSITNISSLTPSIRVLKKLIDHSFIVSDIFYSSDMHIIASACKDGCVNLYTLPLMRLFRSIYIDNHTNDYVFVSSCPLACVVSFAMNTKTIMSYSINGKFLASLTEETAFKSPKLVRDSNFCEYIIYITTRKVVVRSLPYLENVKELLLSIRDPEMLDVDSENKVCYVGNMQGSEWVYIVNKEV